MTVLKHMRAILLLLLALMSLPASAALQWSIGEGRARPGETGFVEIRVRNEGGAPASEEFVLSVDSRRASIPFTGLEFDSEFGASCLRRNDSVADILLFSPPPPGQERLACRLPLSARPDGTRFASQVRGFVKCPGGGCEPVIVGTFHIDGPAHWRERALIVVPREGAPPTAQITAFDYANSTARAPLAMLETPRPANVAGFFAATPADNAYAKDAVAPNAAVAALLRSVRVIYADEASRAQAQAAVTHDPLVEGVIAQPPGYGIRTWPVTPRAGEPFALWLAGSICSYLQPRHHDDRTVEVLDGRIEVVVPFEQLIDFTCPGFENYHLLNMPGVPQGEYVLAISATSLYGTQERIEIALTVLPAGAGSVPGTLRTVPASTSWGLALLALAVAATALLRRR